MKIMFWDVAGLGNKDKDFWNSLRDWEIICLTETWVEEKGWEKKLREIYRRIIYGRNNERGGGGRRGG